MANTASTSNPSNAAPERMTKPIPNPIEQPPKMAINNLSVVIGGIFKNEQIKQEILQL